MARIGNRIVSSQRLTTGAATAPRFTADNSIGRALAGLGSDIEGIAERQRVAEDKVHRFKAAKDLEILGYTTDQQMLDSLGSVQPGAVNYTKGQLEAFDKNGDEFLASVPEHLRPEFQARVERLRGNVSGKAARTELSERQRFYREGLSDTGERLGRSVESNPDGLDGARKSIGSMIETADLPPVEKEKLKGDFNRLLSAKAIGGLVERGRANDARLLAAQSNRIGDRFVDRVVNIESGGNPNAKAKTSSALGLGQFTNGTWLRMVESQRPDLLKNRSEQQVLELRKNPDLSREMIGRLANENAASLSSQGLPVNNTTLYLSHFLGAGGAAAVLKAPKGTKASAVLGSDAVSANKSILENKSVDQVLAWANKKVSGPAPDGVEEPSFNALADTEQIIAGRGTQVKESISLGIEQGTVTSPEQITNSEFLDDGAKTTLLRQLRTRQGTVLNAQQAIAEYDAGGAFYDASNAKDNKKLDAVAQAKGADKESLLALDTDAATVATEIAQRSGVVPPSVRATIRAQVSNGSDEARVYGLSLMDRIYRTSPEVARRDFSKADIDKMVQYRTLIEAGRTEAEALEAVKAQTDPALASVRKQLREEGQKQAQEIDIGEVENVFDPSVFVIGPGAPEDEIKKRRLLEAYRSLFVDSFEKHGDADLANEQASVSIKKTFGPSKVNNTGALGQGEIMRYPPEAHYPAIDGDAPHAWMKPQLERDVFKQLGTPKPKDKSLFSKAARAGGADVKIQIVPDARTSEDVSAGRLPSYTVMIERDGVIDILRDKDNQPFRYRFDAKGALDQHRREALKQARQDRTDFLANRRDIEKIARESVGAEIERP